MLGYCDRIEDRVLHVPLKGVGFEPEDHFDCSILDEQGTAHMVPLDRIRAVFKEGVQPQLPSLE